MFVSTPILPTTCGLVVISPAGWLLGRSTGTPHWDLPKGKMDPGETPLQAALRECQEETSLDLSIWSDHFEDLGVSDYNKKRGKRLHLFRLTLPDPMDLSACQSQTWVLRDGQWVLDMDLFSWVPHPQVADRVNKRMRKHLLRRALI